MAAYGPGYYATILRLRENYFQANEKREQDERLLRLTHDPSVPYIHPRKAALDKLIQDNLSRYLSEKIAYDSALPTKEQQNQFREHLIKSLRDAIHELEIQSEKKPIQEAKKTRLEELLHGLSILFPEHVTTEGGSRRRDRRTRTHKQL